MLKLNQLLRNKEFWMVDAKRWSVRPFPGRYPTRWMVRFLVAAPLKPGQIFHDYQIVSQGIIKPNREMANRIVRAAKFHKQGYLMLAEFDRLGAFRFLYRPIPRTDFNVQSIAGLPSYYYYPWHMTGGDFFDPWAKSVYSKQLILGERPFFIYSPYAKMKSVTYHTSWKEYGTWLKGAKPWK